MSELKKAMIFLVLGMAICFTYILYKNRYYFYINGQEHFLGNILELKGLI